MSTELKTADGTPPQVYGQTEITSLWSDTAFIITLIVADLDDLSGILGFHFLSENNATFDLKKIH